MSTLKLDEGFFSGSTRLLTFYLSVNYAVRVDIPLVSCKL
jgi:hypothetical protein